MVSEGASEAKVMAAIADYRRDNPIEITLFHRAVDGVDAVGSRTPFEIVLVVDICARE